MTYDPNLSSVWSAWFVEALSKFAGEVQKNTGGKGLKRVTLSRDLAINFGLMPGESARVHTAAGYVEVAAD